VPFEIISHPGDAIFDTLTIVEVIYPSHPTEDDIGSYVTRAHAFIDAQRGLPFSCLADQSALRVMPPELVTTLVELNTYAHEHGMLRTARVISSAVAALQAQSLARENVFELQSFESRDEALVWLREKRAR
jgi:hypothetical protein